VVSPVCAVAETLASVVQQLPTLPAVIAGAATRLPPPLNILEDTPGAPNPSADAAAQVNEMYLAA
jgi:hypothetical protein